MPVKFILTALTLGAGFQGGEVTPLFDIGASFGGWYANLFGIELFGAEAVPYFVFASLISFIASGKSGIYSSQERKLSKSLFSAKADFSE